MSQKQSAHIETPRLLLDGISPAQMHELFETKSESEIKTLFGVGDADYAYYKEMYDKGMETFRITQFHFLVINKGTKQTMGEIGFHTINTKHNRAELFYLLRTDDFKNKGFMSEAIEPILEYGFNKLGLNRIEAKVGSENLASIKLLMKNGFTLESTLRQDYLINGTYYDSDCYVLLKSEWSKTNTH